MCALAGGFLQWGLPYFVSSNSKTTIIHTTLFRNIAGESPRNSRDPAGSSRTIRKVFEIDIKKPGL